ncbi:hypothetical protein AB685_15750 [Bacillus sp. LL01]|uniref:hypothetical protein n=1 Tax=Bacillus sp. LL01 TaxID=1665556 RepID=UPI00064D51F8|nr:hypothetical protein [Bacillus sp. LL01]KMJ57468.1 hypothetical protein AB685_15750 [Bacillus sp. LL01]
MKSKVQLLLLVLTVLSTILLIWAGFSGKNDIFPLLLTLVVTLSMGNLMLGNRHTNGFPIYGVAFGFALASFLLSVTFFVVR